MICHYVLLSFGYCLMFDVFWTSFCMLPEINAASFWQPPLGCPGALLRFDVLDKWWFRDEIYIQAQSLHSIPNQLELIWSKCGLFNSERKLIKLSQLSIWRWPKTLQHCAFVTVSWGSQWRLRRLQSSLVLACLRHAESSTFHVNSCSIHYSSCL